MLLDARRQHADVEDVYRMLVQFYARRVTALHKAEVVVDASGNVTDPKVVQSIPLLDDAALQAVRNWHYSPATLNGQPVPVRMTVTVNFTLPPNSPPRPRTALPR